MNKILLVLSLILLLMGTANADELTLGYCNGSVVETALSEGSSVAICLPGREFKIYKGSSIIGLRIGLASDAPNGINIFFKDSPESDAFVSKTTGTLYKGWNDIYLDSAVKFPDGDLYVGYEAGQTVLAGLSGFAGLSSTNSCWVLRNTGWEDLSLQGQQPLCIQVIVDGNGYKYNDVALLSADDITAMAKRYFTITGYLRNNTSRVLSEIRMSLDWDSEHIEADVVLPDILPGEIGQYSFPVEEIARTGIHEAILGILSVAGSPDEYHANDTVTCTIGLLGQYVVRKVLLEEFTGMRCTNCPSGHDRITEALKGIDDYVMIAHHIGFGRDNLTATDSDDLLWFYNNNGNTFTPGLMVDRISQGSGPSPVSTVGESTAIRNFIEKRIAVPAEVTVDILRNYDPETRMLTINVTAAKIEGAEISGDPVLTVCLLENGIIDSQAPTYDNYEHNNANRLFVTAPLGDSIDIAQDTPVSLTYTVNVNEKWNSSNMEVVAFVSNCDSQDCNKCTVYNAAKCALEGNDPINAIGGVMVEPLTIEGIYDIWGLRQESLKSGINIIRHRDGSIRKIIK